MRRLAALDELAASNGAFIGQGAADAQAILPQLKLLDAAPEEDAAALSHLAHWCARFSPSVAIDTPDGLFIDIDGCDHLWGGEEAMARTLRDRLARDGMPARLAIADTFGAAWALARFGEDDIAIVHGDPAPHLFALPVAALRLEPGIIASLRRLGLKTVGEVLQLPRAALRKRFGVALSLQLGRALGAEDEALSFLHPPAPWSVRRVFAEPITRPEHMQRIVHELTQALCARLDTAGLGARNFTAVFHRVDGASAQRGVNASLPMRDPKRLAALFAPKLEDLDPGFGVEAVMLTAEGAEPLRVAQSDLVQAAADARNADLAPLIDRLRNRLGAENVWCAAPFPSHVPERAVTRIAPLDKAQGAWPEDRPRPIRLFKRPQPIEAVAPVPDDPPVLFRWRGTTHRVRRAEGPERIGSEWWRKPWAENGVARVRDYYRVEDETGARFWLFRTGLYGGDQPTRWYLHGLFA